MACTGLMGQTQNLFDRFPAKLQALRSLGLHCTVRLFLLSSSFMVHLEAFWEDASLPQRGRQEDHKTTLFHTDLQAKPAQQLPVPKAVHSVLVPGDIFTFPGRWKDLYTHLSSTVLAML